MLTERIKVARGETKADLLFTNGRVIDVYGNSIVQQDVAVWQDRIIGIGPGYRAKQTVDLQGACISPGFIDAHVHIESSMVEIPQFTRAVLPIGTTTVVTDPHEIANVLGYEGIRYMMDSAKHNPLNVYFMLSSCVPSTHLETSGSQLRAFDILPLLESKWILGLAEMMNYPGVLNRDQDVMDKLGIVGSKRVDGHAPGLSGKDLNAYIAAGVESDHECTTAEEAEEKLRCGMYIMIREGSGAKNLQALLPLVNQNNERRFMFCTDDRHPHDILKEGHINYIIRQSVRLGLPPITAIRMATLNPAEYFNLRLLGAIAPGKMADLVIFEDFESMAIQQVYKNGKLVASKGKPVYKVPDYKVNPVRSSVNIKWLEGGEFQIPATGKKARVIEIIPDQIVTKELITPVSSCNGLVESDTEHDILHFYVLERHRATGNIGKGLVKGFGLKQGAVATTINHDSHNLAVLGVDEHDIEKAVITLNKIGGGIAVVCNREVVDVLELPIAGLMSHQPLETISKRMHKITESIKALGCELDDPVMLLSFLALPVIPQLKLTDKGLVDVSLFKHVDLFVK
ncbi:MAG: adenine deaminase [candidate division KSB1 bacterium]|nr:adenine deaminase [candidate division KSB1 bacterium]